MLVYNITYINKVLILFNQNTKIICFCNFLFISLQNDFNQRIYMDIRKVIKEQGYTIEKVADKMGISRVTLSQNMSRNPTVATLERIANAIGCEVGAFFENTNEESFSAIIDYKGELRKVTSVEELEKVVKELKGSITNKINENENAKSNY